MVPGTRWSSKRTIISSAEILRRTPTRKSSSRSTPKTRTISELLCLWKFLKLMIRPFIHHRWRRELQFHERDWTLLRSVRLPVIVLSRSVPVRVTTMTPTASVAVSASAESILFRFPFTAGIVVSGVAGIIVSVISFISALTMTTSFDLIGIFGQVSVIVCRFIRVSPDFITILAVLGIVNFIAVTFVMYFRSEMNIAVVRL